MASKSLITKYIKMDLIKSISVTQRTVQKQKIIDIRLDVIDLSCQMEWSIYDIDLNFLEGVQYVLIMENNTKVKLIDYLEF
jgi:hypothetical protein